MIEIDASTGEGGGQVVRTAVVLSLLTGTSTRLRGIRAGRESPGLKWQLLLFLDAVRSIADVEMTGATKGSTDLTFIPGPIRGGTQRLRSEVAIAIPLVLDGLLPICAFAKEASDLQVDGATDIEGAMTLDYFRHVIVPRFPQAQILEVRRGYYPTAGGSVCFHIQPGAPPPISSVLRPIERIELYASASEDLRKTAICEEALLGASSALGRYHLCSEAKVEYTFATCSGGSITAVAVLENGSRLGIGVPLTVARPPSALGAQVGRDLLTSALAGSADALGADSILLSLSLVGGTIQLADVTLHARATISICQRFLGPLFRIDGRTISVDHPWCR
jgi:RNA 3'-terminal phosphate cyclase (ATP)